MDCVVDDELAVFSVKFIWILDNVQLDEDVMRLSIYSCFLLVFFGGMLHITN